MRRKKELYNLTNVDDSSDGSDAVDHDEDKAQSENLIVDDGLVVRGYNLVEEFSKVMMGLEPTKDPKTVKKRSPEENGRPSMKKLMSLKLWRLMLLANESWLGLKS